MLNSGDNSVVHGVVQHLALFYHVDGEQAGQWQVTTVPVDKNGFPARLCAEPDPRYPQGFKSFGFLNLYHEHTNINGDVESYALYKQRRYMLDTERAKRHYRRDADEA